MLCCSCSCSSSPCTSRKCRSLRSIVQASKGPQTAFQAELICRVYTIPLQVGRRRQNLSLQVDTGSADLVRSLAPNLAPRVLICDSGSRPPLAQRPRVAAPALTSMTLPPQHPPPTPSPSTIFEAPLPATSSGMLSNSVVTTSQGKPLVRTPCPSSSAFC